MKRAEEESFAMFHLKNQNNDKLKVKSEKLNFFIQYFKCQVAAGFSLRGFTERLFM